MNPKLKSYLIILLCLIVGLLVMGTAGLFKLPDWFNSAFLLLAMFIVVNLITSKVFHLKKEIQAFWSVRKIYFLPIGIFAGGLIGVSPVLAGILATETTLGGLKWSADFTAMPIFVTLAIVAWEELWFRGIFINYCNRYLSAVNISVTIGLLFMLVHMMNPEISLLKTGPALFFAGALLTIVYFYFRTIWLPIGLHFGNNYLSIESNLDTHWLFGNEGYFGAMVLAGFFLLFVRLTWDRDKQETNIEDTPG